jgi:hypothetical protein
MQTESESVRLWFVESGSWGSAQMLETRYLVWYKC